MSDPHTFAELEGKIDELTNFSVKMFGRRFILNPIADLQFQPSTLGQSIQEQPSKFAFYASVRDMANSKLEAVQAKVDQRRSQLDKEYRAAGFLPNGAKITEDALNRYLRADESVVALQDQARDARHELAILSSIVRAFEQRRDMLIQMNNRASNTMFNDSDIKGGVQVNATIKTLVKAAKGTGTFQSE